MNCPRVLVALSSDLHRRNWKASGLLGMMTKRWGAVEVRGPDEACWGAPWRRWLRRGPLRTASYVSRARRSPIYRLKLRLRARRALRFRLGLWLWRAVGLVADPERVASLLEQLIPVDGGVLAAVKRLSLDVVVLPTTIHEGLEVEWAKAARRLGIPVVSHAATWDCLISKGGFIGWRPNRLLVWGEQAKRQAMAEHGFTAEEITVSGSPQYDAYFAPDRPTAPLDGQEVAQQPFILVAGTTPFYWRDEAGLLRWLSEAAQRGALPAWIWYRPHPVQQETRARRWADGLPYVVLDPGWHPGWDWQPEDLAHLRWLLEHAACVISAWSTLVLEAALLGTPSVLIAFGGAAAELGEWEHIAPLRNWPGVDVVQDFAELLTVIGLHLAAPPCGGSGIGLMWRADMRARADALVRAADGRARERICEAIEEVARILQAQDELVWRWVGGEGP